jgi:predicted sugar kinase
MVGAARALNLAGLGASRGGHSGVGLAANAGGGVLTWFGVVPKVDLGGLLVSPLILRNAFC